ncbi:hypothetical protein CHPC595_0047 [Streptococcus phage CHPC595]|uniref:Uncharacterized protein n=1 Tax=Streptococcus phage CHPC595 TaxID=2365036 RepID=A0A3G8FCA9_9CAUD|nr:hypothetical protein PP208_gp46 [Streptococcus phage CHPC595]AZF92336.1 hypothetical protein CHPC595_0047 [Streptococcus phage CHPC595]
MKVAHELPNSTTSYNLGINALYLIATLPEKATKKQGIARFSKKGGYSTRCRFSKPLI